MVETPLRRAVSAHAERKNRAAEDANDDFMRHFGGFQLRPPSDWQSRPGCYIDSTMSFCVKGGETGLAPPKFAVKVVNWGKMIGCRRSSEETNQFSLQHGLAVAPSMIYLDAG